MMRKLSFVIFPLVVFFSSIMVVLTADVIPNEVQQPGTQPVSALTCGFALITNNAISDPVAKHQLLQSHFHRDVSFCVSCHDMSIPVGGDLVHNTGAQSTNEVITSSVHYSTVDTKAAFSNFPYQYSIVENIFGEHYAGTLSHTLISNYARSSH